jgi:predicted RNA-binding Zn ribbon-like protein
LRSSPRTFRPEPQPGNRRPAPGDLGLVQAFANTFWDLRRGQPERLRSPQMLAAWLRSRRLLDAGARLDAADLRRTLAVRDGIRALLVANSGGQTNFEAIQGLNRELRGCDFLVRFSQGAPEFQTQHRGLHGALGLIAASVAVAQLDGRFSRLKVCPGPNCGWAFYDDSRNQAGTWCSSTVCGSRVKARRYRERRRRPART